MQLIRGAVRSPGQDLGVSDAQAIFAAGGGSSDGERDVQLGRERSEESAARGAERAGERAEAGGDASSRMRQAGARGSE